MVAPQAHSVRPRLTPKSDALFTAQPADTDTDTASAVPAPRVKTFPILMLAVFAVIVTVKMLFDIFLEYVLIEEHLVRRQQRVQIMQDLIADDPDVNASSWVLRARWVQ